MAKPSETKLKTVRNKKIIWAIIFQILFLPALLSQITLYTIVFDPTKPISWLPALIGSLLIFIYGLMLAIYIKTGLTLTKSQYTFMTVVGMLSSAVIIASLLLLLLQLVLYTPLIIFLNSFYGLRIVYILINFVATLSIYLWPIIGTLSLIAIFRIYTKSKHLKKPLRSTKKKSLPAQKILFTIPWTKTINIPVKLPRKRTVKIITLCLLILFYGLGSGMLLFTVATVKCLSLPITASSSVFNEYYSLPGEYGYGPSSKNAYFCTAYEAKQAGYSHNPLTEGARAESKARSEANRIAAEREKEEQKLMPTKVPYRVYIPTSQDITVSNYSIEEDKNSKVSDSLNFKVSLKIEGKTKSVGMAEYSKGPAFDLCSEYRCKTVATDSQGRDIYRLYYKGGYDIYSTGTMIDGTVVLIGGTEDPKYLVPIFDSMQPYQIPKD